MPNKRTPLYRIQSENGGRMIDFQGWDMPVQFAGIREEHLAVRGGCGAFDLGHMGRLRLHGPDALAFLESRISRKLGSMREGQVRYGLVLAADGTVIDDVLVSREGAESWHVVVNASNRSTIIDAWSCTTSHDAFSLEDLTQEQAMIAVQGPQSVDLLAGLGLDGRELKYYSFCDCGPVRLSRTGYTGENGYECFLPADQAEDLWQRLMDAGVTPCGLGARDTLRLEAGMPLYGNELDRQHTPIEAGLGFAVAKNKPYIGREVCARQRAKGTAVKLVGLISQGKRVARPGYEILAGQCAVGTITSGTLSPTLGHPIAMAYVATGSAATGAVLQVDIRGRATGSFTVVDLPFYRREA
ncbi:MAG: glycine cleavage system aminomethyltransferase GcvT [Planctomycetota bacterium]